MSPRIALLLSDVDGTLVTSDKRLSPRTLAAVAQLREAGVQFAITSGRATLAMRHLVEPLTLTTPLGGFNGGQIVTPDWTVLETHTIEAGLVTPIVERLQAHHLDAWVYRHDDWLVRDAGAPYVDHETHAGGYGPRVVPRVDAQTDGVIKVVGVSADAAAVDDAREQLTTELPGVSASSSQPYYLDVTAREATKGHVVDYLTTHLGVRRLDVAVIGDMHNDLSMFARAGLAIAMGNGSPDVRRAAGAVTRTNDDDGFAYAVERFILTT